MNADKDKVASEGGGSRGRHLSVMRRSAGRLAAIQTLYQYRFANDSDSGDGKHKNKGGGETQSLLVTMVHYEAHYLPALLAEMGLARLHADMGESHYRRLLMGLAGEAGDGEAAVLAGLDEVIGGYLGEGWGLGRLPPLDVDTLRLAVYELQACADIPARAIIAEYAAIAEEAWGADARYITAVLDKVAHATRADEMKGD